MQNKTKRGLALVLGVVLSFGAFAAACAAPKLDPNNPVVVTAWVYYNGHQQQTLERLMKEFNETVGAREGIIVEAVSQGNISELTEKLLASANGEVGAEAMPDFFAAYADTAYQLNQSGAVADISQYLTAEEQAQYVDAYLKEGVLDEGGALKIFPVAKATELLLLNETAWQPFAEATGAERSKLSTWEGIVELAESYYRWTDAQTPEDGDGKAFFGRDAFANYLLIGSLQLGVEIFRVEGGQLTLQIDDAVMRKLWDHYYVPYVSGWFGAYGRFRSDDIKTGQIIALVGSTSGALYFPTEVTHDDGTALPIESSAQPLPNFAGTQPMAVQQGAGMVVTKGDPVKEYAATVFLKWFSDTQNNIEFSIHSGYLPVKKEANDPALLGAIMDEEHTDASVRRIIDTGVIITSTYQLYTNNAFEHGFDARQVLESSMTRAASDALAQRQALQSTGMSYEEALLQVLTDEAFGAWLASLKADMQKALQE